MQKVHANQVKGRNKPNIRSAPHEKFCRFEEYARRVCEGGSQALMDKWRRDEARYLERIEGMTLVDDRTYRLSGGMLGDKDGFTESCTRFMESSDEEEGGPGTFGQLWQRRRREEQAASSASGQGAPHLQEVVGGASVHVGRRQARACVARCPRSSCTRGDGLPSRFRPFLTWRRFARSQSLVCKPWCATGCRASP